MTKKTKIVLILVILVLASFFIFYFSTQTKNDSLCWPYCPNMTDEDRAKIKEDMRKAGCPDQMIVNKMPGVADNKSSNSTNSYYIKNGKRVEISEYDPIWVNANCEVPVQEVQ